MDADWEAEIKVAAKKAKQKSKNASPSPNAPSMPKRGAYASGVSWLKLCSFFHALVYLRSKVSTLLHCMLKRNTRGMDVKKRCLLH